MANLPDHVDDFQAKDESDWLLMRSSCRKNIEHLVGDATELDLEEGSADVIFSNWLLMYLDDDEVADLASDALAWVSSPDFPRFLTGRCLRANERLCIIPA